MLQPLLPPPAGAVLALLLAALLLLRLAFWKPLLGLSRIDIGVMYLGYLAITAQLLLESLHYFSPVPWIGSLSLHVFTFGAMGLVIPAMLIRIAKGHTGRKVIFETLDKLALGLMLLGFVLRIVMPQFFPAAYVQWIYLAAACWLGCFGLLGWRLIPFLLAPGWTARCISLEGRHDGLPGCLLAAVAAGLQHPVVQHHIDRRRQVHAAVGRDVDDILAPGGDVLPQTPILRAEDVESPLRVAVLGQGLGLRHQFDGHRHTAQGITCCRSSTPIRGSCWCTCLVSVQNSLAVS